MAQGNSSDRGAFYCCWEAYMIRIRLIALVVLALFLVACGSTPAPRKIDGAWKASVLNPDLSVAYTIDTTLNQGTGSSVEVISFNFTSAAPCFSDPLGQSATFSATGHSGGVETGPFAMNVSTAFGTGMENVLALTGTRNADGTITGTWTQSGLSGCSGSGNYTMTLLPAL
jgi:hypothetical protein